jgi:hypothetical protein
MACGSQPKKHEEAFMRGILHKVAVLGVIAVCGVATAQSLAQQRSSRNPARSNEAIVRGNTLTPDILAAINAHAAKANRIAQQIRERSGDMDDASYLNLSLALLGASEAGLDAAVSAQSYRTAMTVIRSANKAGAGAVIQPETTAALSTGKSETATSMVEPNSLGSASTEFVFYPIVPCRVLDTREGAGIQLTPLVPYPVDFDGGNPGNAAGCTFQGVLDQLGGVISGLSRTALAINLTVTGASENGWIQARPVGSANLTSNQNFYPGRNIANMVIVQDAGTFYEFELVASKATHAVVDMLGVFATPLATALECTVASQYGPGTSDVADGTTFSFDNPVACPAGYTLAQVTCEYNSSNAPAGLALWQGGTSGGGRAACAWRNQTGGTLNSSDFHTGSRCCRLPGR